jgi:hypothetical protein
MAAQSPMAGLKARHAQLKAEAESKYIPVPGWSEPSMFLRIHPIDHPTLRKFGMKVQRAKGDAKGNVDLVSGSGVIATATDTVIIGELIDGVPSDDSAELGLFSPELAEALGITEKDPSALTILRELVLNKDGAILRLVARVQEHSGYVDDAADEDLLGE